MDYLLDTHIFLWAAMTPGKLNDSTRLILEDDANTIYVSVITFWELSLKFGIGKLELQGILPDAFPAAAESMGFSVLPMNQEHAASFYSLPRENHKDPFDRMLIWQAINQGITLISKDSAFSDYCDLGLKLKTES